MSIYLHPFAATIWALDILATSLLAWMVWSHPGQRRHDLFAIYCTYSALASTSLFICSAMNDGVAYTFIYACSAPTRTAIGLFTICRCIWKVTRRHLRMHGGGWKLALDYAPYVVCAASLALRFKPTAETLWISLEWVIVLLSGGLMWVISFATDSWKLQWRTREYGICAGFLWLYSLRFLIVGLRVVIPPALTPSLYWIDVCITAVAVGIWIRFFIKKEPEIIVPTGQQLTQLVGLLHNFEKHSEEISR